ncbi:MAG: M1 family metallopeptidase [Saprospiraceae bacterium]
MKRIGAGLIICLLCLSCGSPKAMQKSVMKPNESDTALTEMEYRHLDTLEVTPERNGETKDEIQEPLLPYRPSYTRRWDLIHTSLVLKFDWNAEHVLGVAKLKLVPLFYTMDSLELDAKTFDMGSVTANGRTINFSYHDDILKLILGKKYTRTDTLNLVINYTAKPSENITKGSAAITDDNGLYFIDAHDTDPLLPTQLWSQGETENNSRWFPTIDKPNERMTIDITLTVPDSMITLSNGLMTSTSMNPDKTRTDTWVMDQPIAPYLVMIAAGPFAKVSEMWKGIPVEYYVDKAYGPYAKDIFHYTPEMLTFFSDKLGLKYPWKKFSQIIVKKYVSGAMENTTAVVFGDFIEKTRRELIDEPNDYIVAHEMFHHWFGDYVTCESWSNLTLNEGFANYSEYLWMEHQYGKYEADRHREEELTGYLSSVSFGKPHDLIDYRYADKENMFDAHSYNKGGLVLHMLRYYVGDDAFYTALHGYLIKHAYQSVEVHDLRMAFEEVTGEDLHWFFDQWFLDDGHPSLSYTYEYDKTNKNIVLSLNQTQIKSYPSPFILPIDIDIHHSNGSIERQRVWMNERDQEITLSSQDKPNLVVLDPDRVLLVEWNEPELSATEYAYQWRRCNNLQLRLNALSALTEDKMYPAIWKEAIADPYWNIKLRALDYVPDLSKSDLEVLSTMASKDAHSQVRAAAIRILGEKDAAGLETLLDHIIKSDSAYVVLSEALKAMGKINPAKAGALSKSMQHEKNNLMQEAIADIIVSNDDPSSVDYIENKLSEYPSLAVTLVDKYVGLMTNQSSDMIYSKATFLFKQATKKDVDKNSKFYLMKGLFDLKELLLTRAIKEKDNPKKLMLEDDVKNLKARIQEIKEKETDTELKEIFRQFN